MGEYFDVDEKAATELAQKAEDVGTTGGDETRWLKFNAGTHVLRITPAWSGEGLFVRTYQRHCGPFGDSYTTPDNYHVQPLCLKWILQDKNKAFREILLEMERLDDNTLSNASKAGCPLDWLPRNIMSREGEDNAELKKIAKPFWATTRHLWNVVYVSGPGPGEVGRVHVMDTSNKFYKSIMANVALRPTLFHPEKGADISYTAVDKKEGKRVRRNYDAPIVMPESSPLDTPDGPYNLDVLAGKAGRKWDELIGILECSHEQFENERYGKKFREMMDKAGIDVGLTDDNQEIDDDDIPF